MLHDQGLPLHLWAEAYNTSVYLQNRSLHRILGMKTPMEAFSRKRPDVSHFRIFGSSIYCHVTKDAQKKLEPTAELAILMGYINTPHNYRVFLTTSQRTMVRRDLKFDKQKAMQVFLESELKLHAEEELLIPKEEEPQTDAKQPHAEDPGVETSTHAESSRDGQKRSTEVDRLVMDLRENVGQPASQHRHRRSPERYIGYMALVWECVKTEPSSFEEAVQYLVWVDAMVEEYNSIVRNSVWDVFPRPEEKLVVSSRWLYKVKQAADGSVEKHKARFVARGFSQTEGIDYDETFVPVARIGSYFTRLGFIKSEADANLYHIMVEGKPLIIVLYVDDLIFTGDDQLIKSCKEDLAREFEMKDMGLMHYFLGMEVWHKDGEVFVSQGKYANEILRRFHMEK
eukprot:PITA_08558